MEYYLATKRNEVLIYTTTWMALENIIHSGRRPHIVFHIYKSRIGKFPETESAFVVAWGWRNCGETGSDTRRYRFSWGNENILKLIVMMVTQL